MTVNTADQSPFTLTVAARERLRSRLQQGISRGRQHGHEILVALTIPLERNIDPSAVLCASRRPGEPWFLFEQPDRGRFALAALGETIAIRSEGPQRFTEVALKWRRLVADALADPSDSFNGSGLIGVGGFAFASGGCNSPHWSLYEPASLIVPEVAMIRWESDDELQVRLSVMTLAAADDIAEDLLTKIELRLSELHAELLPLADPQLSGSYKIVGSMPPEHYEAAVARAVEMIEQEKLEKIVLAREVQVNAPCNHDPVALFGVLREAFPSCFVFCVGRGEKAFVGASPELLIRRQGASASTIALAGSTRRSADPAVDRHLGEQLLRSAKDLHEQSIVTRRIERTLRPHALWVTAAGEPTLVKIANIQHLATPIRAQLASPIDTLELLGAMHPTPAVGGEPLDIATPIIPALEGLDRGWYAGPIGWTDANGDGEFCVALRCALLEGKIARCYAGVGVVRDSEPAVELAETELKLQALLPVLAG